MNKKRLLLSAGILLSITLTLQSQPIGDPIRLNEISIEELNKEKSVKSKVFYKLNAEGLRNEGLEEGQEIIVQTARGEKKLEITRVSEFVKGYTSIRATSSDHVFAFTIKGERLSGIFHSNGSEDLFFKYDGKVKRNFITSEKEKELSCSHDIIAPTLQKFSKEKGKTATEGIASSLSSDDPSEETVLDLLIVYTRNASGWAFSNSSTGDIEGEIAQALNLSQSALDNSKIPITIRLVHIYQTSFDEGFAGTESGNTLRVLTASPSFNPFGVQDGEIDEVHELRDQYGADLVAMVAQINDTGGLAWRLNSRYGSPEFGFSVNRVQQISSGYTLIHEIGHNFGNAHSRTQAVQTAGITGGVFHESVGYQNLTRGTHTIMAYNAEGLTQIPVFSGVNLFWEGTRAGLRSPTDITDASTSMKKIKGIISNYRRTTTEPPISDVATNKISVTLGKDGTLKVPLMINNTGLSNLEYSIDFVVPEGVLFKEKSTKNKNALTNTNIFSTGFENSQGFPTGTYTAINSWRIFSDNGDPDFLVTNESPRSGPHHLRITNQPSVGTKFLYSPFWGNQRFGSYKVSFSFKIPNVPNIENEQISFLLADGFTENVSAGIRIDNGNVHTLSKTENDIYVSSGVQVTKGSYNMVDIEYNAVSEEISYSFNNQNIASTGFTNYGNTPSEMITSYSNTVAGGYVDIDGITITRIDRPYRWLDIDDYSSIIKPGGSKEISLSFNAAGLETGVYNALMVINTNEEGIGAYEVPLELQATNIVSNEFEYVDELKAFSVNQNYPNPFNPSTNIDFHIPRAGEVTLRVYDTLGRKVSTLVNRRLNAGSYSINFNAGGLSTGVYIYKVSFLGYEQTRKMLLIK